MELEKYSGIDIEGFVFDGTFEASVKISSYLRENAQHRVSKFSIQHYNSGSRVGETNLSFTLLPVKGDPNAREVDYVLNIGDFLRVQPSNFEVIKKGMLSKYWKEVE